MDTLLLLCCMLLFPMAAHSQKVEWISAYDDSLFLAGINHPFSEMDEEHFVSIIFISKFAPFSFYHQTIPGRDSFPSWLCFKLNSKGELVWTLRIEQRNLHLRNNVSLQNSSRGLISYDNGYALLFDGGGGDFYTYLNGTPQDTIKMSGRVGSAMILKISNDGTLEWSRSLFKRTASSSNSYTMPRWIQRPQVIRDTLSLSVGETISPNQFAADSTYIQLDSQITAPSLLFNAPFCGLQGNIFNFTYNKQGTISTLTRYVDDSLFVRFSGMNVFTNTRSIDYHIQQVSFSCPSDFPIVRNGFPYAANRTYFVRLDTNGLYRPLFSLYSPAGYTENAVRVFHSKWFQLGVMPMRNYRDSRFCDSFINHHENLSYVLDTSEFLLYDKNFRFRARKRLFSFQEGHDSVNISYTYVAFSEKSIYVNGTITNDKSQTPLTFFLDGVLYRLPEKNTRFYLKLDTLLNVLWFFSGDASSSPVPLKMEVDGRGDIYLTGDHLANTGDFVIFGDTIKGRPSRFQSIIKITDYSITRGEVFAGPYCAGDSMEIPYTIKGVYDPGNRFIAQLSDENGNFDDTTKIRTLGWIESTEDSTIRGELPLFEVSSSGNYRIRVISTNPPVQSFYKEDSLRLLIYSRDKADPGPDETICLGDSFQLNTFGGTAWEWSPAINMDDSTLRQPSVWPSTNTTYRIVISDSSGCGEPDTAFKNILIRPNPKIDLPSDEYVVCLREPAQIQAHFYDGDTSGYRWSWRFAQGIWQELNRDSFRTSTAVDFALTSTTPRSRLLAIILEDGCHPKPDTAFVNVRLSPHRVRSILSTQDSVICYQSQQNLIANISGGDSLTYQWQWFEVDAMGEFSLIKQDSLRFSDTLQVQLRPESKDFQRYALVSNDNCIPFFDTAYFDVNINPHQPQAGILPTDTAICPSTEVELVGQVNNGSALGYAFVWLDEVNNILQTDTGFSPQNFSPTPDFSGGQSERMYRLVAQDLCSPYADTAQTRIIPLEPLQAIPNTFDTTVCSGQELSLSASGLGGVGTQYQFQWILNDRIISSESDVMVTLREPQGDTMSVQNLKLVISDNCMPQNDTADITVRVKPALQSVILREPQDNNEPHHDFAVQDTTVCSGSELRFFAKALGGDSTNYSYEWLWNDSLIGTTEELVFTPIHPSPSTLHLITKDGCTVPNDTTSITINILPPLQVSFTAADTLCLGEELELIAEANGGVDSNYMYQWILNGNIVSETDSFILNGIHPSPSTLQLVLSDGCSSPNDTFVHEIYVRPSLTIDLFASTLCANPTTTLSANPSGGNPDNYLIQWFDEAENMLGEGLSIEVTPTRLTTYRASLSDGCSADTASAQIQIDLVPSLLELTASPTEGCEPLPVDFEVNTNYSNTFIYTLLFTPSDSSQSLPPTNPPLSFTFSQGIYTPTLILTTQLGCDTTLTGPTITIYPKPTASFSFTPEEPDLDNNSVQFRNLSTGANSYVWNISPFGNFTEAEPNVIYTDSGFHPLQLIAISDQDCRDTVQGQVYIRTNYRVYIPNVFSPNGDGKNDLFRPAMRGFAESDLNIYNRWGERLFQSRDNTGWDGTYRGQPVPDGVYMYTLSVLNLYGEKQFFNGTVVLMR
jgi:gliding motility-associated-like protein